MTMTMVTMMTISRMRIRIPQSALATDDRWQSSRAMTMVTVVNANTAALVQGVKDKIGLKASDVDQGLKICIHGQFYILN